MARLSNNETKRHSHPLKQFHLAMHITGTLQCPIIGVGAGIWLDREYGTQPWLMFALLAGSLAFTIHSVYTAVKQRQKQMVIRKNNG